MEMEKLRITIKTHKKAANNEKHVKAMIACIKLNQITNQSQFFCSSSCNLFISLFFFARCFCFWFCYFFFGNELIRIHMLHSSCVFFFFISSQVLRTVVRFILLILFCTVFASICQAHIANWTRTDFRDQQQHCIVSDFVVLQSVAVAFSSLIRFV